MDTKATRSQNPNFLKFERKKTDIISFISRFQIPIKYLRKMEKLHFNELEKLLGEAVLKIELNERPKVLRIFEFLYGLSFGIAHAFLKAIKLKNITVGDYQIGVLTSLAWTNNKTTVNNYIRRCMFLLMVDGGSRLFRIGIRRFLHMYKGDANQFIESFSEFYNGRPSGKSRIKYEEVLNHLTFNNFSSKSIQYIDRMVVLYSSDRKRRLSRRETMRQSINSKVNDRLKLIKEKILNPDNLGSAVIVCDISSRSVVHSEYYGHTMGSLPIFDTPRSVGSLIKIALYTAYIEKVQGTINMTFVDEPVSFKWNGELFSPKNADKKFRGNVSLNEAFSKSINTVAVKLINELGVKNLIGYLTQCGIYSPLPLSPVLSLGAVNLTGWEVLSTLSPIMAFGHLAWMDNKSVGSFIPSNNGKRLISIHTVKQMKSLLRSVVEIGTASYLNGKGERTAGGKTGTSEGGRDLWFAGIINKDLYGLVWIGNSNNAPIKSSDQFPASSSRFAVPLWSDVSAGLKKFI